MVRMSCVSKSYQTDWLIKSYCIFFLSFLVYPDILIGHSLLFTKECLMTNNFSCSASDYLLWLICDNKWIIVTINYVSEGIIDSLLADAVQKQVFGLWCSVCLKPSQTHFIDLHSSCIKAYFPCEWSLGFVFFTQVRVKCVSVVQLWIYREVELFVYTNL